MIAAPFATFAAGMLLALAGRRRMSGAVLALALLLSLAMFLMHATDKLPISL